MAPSITLIFKATAEELFSAWTEPELVSQWLFKGDDSESVNADIDPTVGGRFLISELTRDGAVDYFGNYVTIDKPRFLAFILEVPKRFDRVSQVQIEFKQMSEECEMMFQQAA